MRRVEDQREPEETIWICSCGHEESTHTLDRETSKFPCMATNCLCDDFTVRDDEDVDV